MKFFATLICVFVVVALITCFFIAGWSAAIGVGYLIHHHVDEVLGIAVAAGLGFSWTFAFLVALTE